MTDADTKQAKPNGEARAEEGFAADGAEPAPDLEKIIAERDEYLDQLQRSRADFANFRRRNEQERAAIREIASQALLTQLLPVFDDLQRALAAVPADKADDPLVKGVELVERKFWNVLERAGVTPLEAQGQPFDPAQHEAVEAVPGSAANTVVAVYQPGYRLGSALLRPAMVKVGDPEPAPASAAAPPAAKEGG